MGLAELVVLRDGHVTVGRGEGGRHVQWRARGGGGGGAANDEAEEETRLADARLADDEELEEQVRSGHRSVHV